MKVSSNIHVVEGRGFDSNMILLVEEDGTFTLVDTGHDDNRTYLIDYIKRIGLDPADMKGVILTHVHVDHSGGLSYLVKKYKPEVMVFEGGADWIEEGDLRMTLAGMFKGYFDAVTVDRRLVDGEVLELGGHSFKVLNTPGHTPDSICLYDEAGKILISGDTVFAGGSFGRTDFPGGSVLDLINSLNMLASLDVEVMLPGHMNCVLGGASREIAMSARFCKMIG